MIENVNISDRDLEALDQHLDGALDARQSEDLIARLARDPELARALETLRAARAARRAAWVGYEPDLVSADATAGAVLARCRQAQRSTATFHLIRRLTVAAVVLIAFGGGWLARSRLLPPSATVSVPIEVRNVDHRGAQPAPAPQVYRVALTDDDGNVVAVQLFDDLRTARQFAEDVDRWQSRPRPAAPGQPPPSSEF